MISPHCTRPARGCGPLRHAAGLGGSSVGVRDFTVEVIAAFPGSEILVHGIAISPGKPTILARVLGKPFWGLPATSSPRWSFCSIAPAVSRHLAGASDLLSQYTLIPARLNRNVASAQGRTDFGRAGSAWRGRDLARADPG